MKTPDGDVVEYAGSDQFAVAGPLWVVGLAIDDICVFSLLQSVFAIRVSLPDKVTHGQSDRSLKNIGDFGPARLS